jgi:hypothetical protein
MDPPVIPDHSMHKTVVDVSPPPPLILRDSFRMRRQQALASSIPSEVDTSTDYQTYK